MKRTTGRFKLIILVIFAVLGTVAFYDDSRIVSSTIASSGGPPPGFTGAPDENSCIACHFGVDTGGQFSLVPPANYTPGQTYQIQVQHVNADPSRLRWGFQMTALSGALTMAGSFSNLSSQTQTVSDSGRQYIHHTSSGTFPGQAGGAAWTVSWTAPATNVGPVTFYAAGNQANNNGSTDGDRIIHANATSQPQTIDPSNAKFDFDGDGKTDIGIYRPGPGEWWINRSSTSQTVAAQFGSAGDVLVPAEYTGDGKADIAIFRPSSGFWFILRSEDSTFFAFPFGTNGDTPAPADYDGDNKADPTVYRSAGTIWFISRSTGGTGIFVFGAPGDAPVPSDYDGDNNADIAIFRPNGANGAEWWISQSLSGQVFAATFGASTDKALPADFTGDGKDDIAFWRPSTGQWFILRSEDSSFFAFPFGTTTDVASPGDYDGDGKTDAAVFRPSSSTWFIQRSTAGTLITTFGLTGDTPIPNVFVRN